MVLRTVRTNRRGMPFVVSGLALLLIAALVILWTVSSDTARGSSPEVATTPSGTPSATATATASPTPTPTPTPKPTATPTPEPTPWMWTGAHLSIPSVGIEADIGQYTAQDLANNGGKVIPPEKNSVVWNSSMYETYGISSYPSASAQYCTHIAAHSYQDGSAIFNALVNMPVGAEATITQGSGEVVTYVKREAEVTVLKSEQGSSPALNDWTPQPGCLKLITCLSEGERDSEGHSIALRVATLWLVGRS